MRALKVCLWIAAVGCLLSVFGIFLPVSMFESFAKVFGIESIPDSPLVEYAIRVMSATYAMVGIFFIILALDPIKYGIMVQFSALGAVLVGMVCAISGLSVGMPLWWFLGDSLSCVVLGILIVIFWRFARQTV